MKYFLIHFTYDFYCQGYEKDEIDILVQASTFEFACQKIMASKLYERPREFINRTIQ